MNNWNGLRPLVFHFERRKGSRVVYVSAETTTWRTAGNRAMWMREAVPGWGSPASRFARRVVYPSSGWCDDVEVDDSDEENAWEGMELSWWRHSSL